MRLLIQKLRASFANKEILKGIDLKINSGEIHVLMGPNGSGKSTLAQVVMGSPLYTINKGQLIFDGKDLKKLSSDKRARLGIFLAFQHPLEVPGVSMFNVLRSAKNVGLSGNRVIRQSGVRKAPTANSEIRLNATEFRKQLIDYALSLKLSGDFLHRSLNEGFSGGEKKRSEILQMVILKPKLAILDEIDSGLDVDALKTVVKVILRHVKEDPYTSVLLITHYARILKYLKCDFVHVMVDGKIVKSGKASLAEKIEEKGYRLWQMA